MKCRSILFCIVFLSEALLSVSSIAAEKETGQPLGPQAEPASKTRAILQNPEQAASATGQATPQAIAAPSILLRNIPKYSTTDRTGIEQVHIQGEMLLDQSAENGPPANSYSKTSRQLMPESALPVEDRQNKNVQKNSNAPGNVAKQWKALSNTGWYPPDTVVAVGPKHVVEAVNSGFAVYSKSGTEIQAYTPFDSFMNKPAGFAGSMFDPRVIYDPIHQRFLMLIIGKDEMNSKSYVWIAVSETSDPTGGWCRWRTDVTDTSGTSTAWLDYVALGVDSWGIYITGNYFYFSGGRRGTYLRTFNVDMFSENCAGASNGWQWKDLKWPDGSETFTLQPAFPHSINSDQQTFFVNTRRSGGNTVLLWKLSGNRTNSPTLSKSEITTSTGYNAIGMNVVQRGSGVRIDGGDARIMNAVYTNKRVFYTLTTDVNNDGDETGWLTVKLNTDSNSEDWKQLLWGNNQYYTYPAITLDGTGANNKLALFGSWSNSNTFVSGIFKMYTDQPNSGAGPFIVYDSGKGVYNNTFTGRNRWGDYSGAAYDWSCGFAWGAAESADTSNRWQTTISARAFDNEDISCLDGAAEEPTNLFVIPLPGGGATIFSL